MVAESRPQAQGRVKSTAPEAADSAAGSTPASSKARCTPTAALVAPLPPETTTATFRPRRAG